MRFEAGWGKDGATCVARVRIPEKVTLEELRGAARRGWPTGWARVARRTRPRRSPATLLLNKS